MEEKHTTTHSCPHRPRSIWSAPGIATSGLAQHSSLQFTDCLSNLTNEIGWKYETKTLHMLRKSGPARGHDSWGWRKKASHLGTWVTTIVLLHVSWSNSQPFDLQIVQTASVSTTIDQDHYKFRAGRETGLCTDNWTVYSDITCLSMWFWSL